LHQKKAEQNDKTLNQSALRNTLKDLVFQIIDSYLQVWAGFVGLGREVEIHEKGDVSRQLVAEIADWWLVLSLSESELASTASDWAASGNPWPLNQTMHSWLSLRVFSALKGNEVLSLTRFEAADRLVARWNPFPFSKKGETPMEVAST
jgi:hypothetical protein